MKNFLIFLLGACAGGAGAYYYSKKKFDEKLTDETESVKKYYDEYYSNYYGKDIVVNNASEDKETEEPEKQESIKERVSVTDYAKMALKETPVKENRTKEDIGTDLRVLSGKNEFEDLSDDYRSEDLVIYADGIVTDVYDKIVFNKDDDISKAIAAEEPDFDGYVYVADDLKSRIYEVSKDYRTYAEVFGEDDE